MDADCYFGNKTLKIRAVAEGSKKEKLYWVKGLLADGGKTEIEALIAGLKKE